MTESNAIGASLPATNPPDSQVSAPDDAAPKSSGRVITHEFSVPPMLPMKGGRALRDVMKRVEAKPAMAALLADARRNLAKEMGIDSRSFRMLRLQSGLSQTKLAERARVTQSYVARVEAGSVDPGTEMIVRLSEALGAPAEKVFVAIIAQRVSQNV